MNDLLHNLIEALREELKQYGEMLAVLEQQQDCVVQRQVNDLHQNIAQINAQADIIAAVRREREQHQRNVARQLGWTTTQPLT
jgi:phage shock protein A